jgi:hypothetical protein
MEGNEDESFLANNYMRLIKEIFEADKDTSDESKI